jgi:hypothetical protein
MVDSVARSVTFAPRASPVDRYVLRYEPLGNGTLLVRGTYAGDSVEVTLETLDHRRVFRLLRGS